MILRPYDENPQLNQSSMLTGALKHVQKSTIQSSGLESYLDYTNNRKGRNMSTFQHHNRGLLERRSIKSNGAGKRIGGVGSKR
jgi:hypothetical protein